MSETTTQTMSPEEFVAYAAAEIEIAKSEEGEARAARLANLAKNVETAKSFSFEGNANGIVVEMVEATPTSTDVAPDKAQQDDPASSTATNFDEVTKRFESALAELKKGDETETKDLEADGEETTSDDDGEDSWPDDMNDASPDLDWGADKSE